jgi:gamma-glutamyltranspeptidase
MLWTVSLLLYFKNDFFSNWFFLEFDFNKSSPATFYHRFAETLKHAYAQRSHLGDSSYVEMNQVTLSFQKNNDFKWNTFPSSW